MTYIKKKADLSKVHLFSGIDDSIIEEYSKHIEIKNYKKGAKLFYEGDYPDYLWLIIEGEVKIFKEYASGKSAIMGIFGEGAVVAEVAIIDGKPYPATCQTVTPAKVGLIKREQALKIITSNPTVAHRVMIGLGDKLRNLTGDLGSMSVQSVIRRLSRFLLKMAEKMGDKRGRDIAVELFLTRKDLAECIGTSFEVAVRCLGKLQNEGIIEVNGKSILIKNRNMLSNLANE